MGRGSFAGGTAAATGPEPVVQSPPAVASRGGGVRCSAAPVLYQFNKFAHESDTTDGARGACFTSARARACFSLLALAGFVSLSTEIAGMAIAFPSPVATAGMIALEPTRCGHPQHLLRNPSANASADSNLDSAAASGAVAGGSMPPGQGEPPSFRWPLWQRCWAAGWWRRLNESEYLARRRSFSDVENAQLASPPRVDNFTWTVASTTHPSECDSHPYLPFHRESFCDALGGRTIFSIHDSMGNLMMDALARLASAPFDGSPSKKSGFRYPYRSPIVHGLTICEDRTPARVVALHNFAAGHVKLRDELSRHTITSQCPNKTQRHPSCSHVAVVPGSEEDRIWGLDELLGEWARKHGVSPGIVLLNAGAHFQPDGVLIPQVRRALAHIAATHPRALVIWRNTPPGHVNCSSYYEPLTVPQPEDTLPYHWGEFRRQNDAISKMIKEEFPSLYYMDVATSTALRADLHFSAFATPRNNNDCLHYLPWVPSPVDNWVRALYNIVVRAPSLRS